MRTLLLVGLLFLTGCTNAERAQFGGFGDDFKVTVYSGGEPVRTWISSGKVMTEIESDGWYFLDAETKKLVRVSGTVVIEQK